MYEMMLHLGITIYLMQVKSFLKLKLNLGFQLCQRLYKINVFLLNRLSKKNNLKAVKLDFKYVSGFL